MFDILRSVLYLVASFTTSSAWDYDKYVRAPTSSTVRPWRVFNISGDVQNADAIVTGQGVATFSRPTTEDTIPGGKSDSLERLGKEADRAQSDVGFRPGW